MLNIIIIIIVLYKLHNCFCSSTDSITMTVSPAYVTTEVNSVNINTTSPDYERISLYVISLICLLKLIIFANDNMF